MLSKLLLRLYSLELSFSYLYIGSILIGYSRGFSDVLSSYIQRIGTIMLNHLRGKSPRAMKKRLAKECSWNTSRTPLIHLQRQWHDGLQDTNWTICQIHSLHRRYTSQQTIPALPSGAGRGKNRGNARKSLIPRSHRPPSTGSFRFFIPNTIRLPTRNSILFTSILTPITRSYH